MWEQAFPLVLPSYLKTSGHGLFWKAEAGTRLQKDFDPQPSMELWLNKVEAVGMGRAWGGSSVVHRYVGGKMGSRKWEVMGVTARLWHEERGEWIKWPQGETASPQTNWIFHLCSVRFGLWTSKQFVSVNSESIQLVMLSSLRFKRGKSNRAGQKLRIINIYLLTCFSAKLLVKRLKMKQNLAYWL